MRSLAALTASILILIAVSTGILIAILRAFVFDKHLFLYQNWEHKAIPMI